MSKEQIEEMAKIFCGMKNGCDGCMFDKVHCNERNCAEEIYNAGYRKQSEPISCGHEKGEWILRQNGKGVCSNCNRQDSIDELAKFCRYCGAHMRKEDDE